MRIGKSHILAGMRKNAPHNQLWICPGIHQPGKPCKRRITVRPPHRLAECTEHVIIERFITAKHGFLNALFGNLHGNMNAPIFCHRGRQHGQFQCAKRRPDVAARDPGDMLHRIRVCSNSKTAVSPLFILQCTVHGQQNVLFGKRFKLKHSAPAHNGRRHGNHGVFRRRPDQADDAFFNCRKDAVRLRLVPAVAFVQKKICTLPVHIPCFFCRPEHFSDFLNA